MRRIALSLLLVAASGAYVWSQSGTVISDDPLGPQPPLRPLSALGSESRLGPEPRNNDISTGSIKKPARVLASLPLPTPSTARPAPAFESEWWEDDEDGERGDDDSKLSPSLAAYVPADPLPSPNPPMPADPPVAVAPAARLAPPATPATPLAQPAAPPAPPPAPIEARLPRPRPAYHAPVVANALLTRTAMTLARNGRYIDGTYSGPVIDAYYGLIQIQAIVQGGQLVGIQVLQYPSDRRLSVRINRYALPILRDEAVRAQSANVNIISGATLTSRAFIRSIGTALRAAAGT